MTDVFYTPPKADLQESTPHNSAFFIVAPRKLLVMLFMTHGMYCAYWLYKNWSLYRASSGRSVWPLARTFFGLFYLPSLFCKMNRTIKDANNVGIPYWGLKAVLFILLSFAPLILGFVIGFTRAAGLHDMGGLGLWFDFWVGTAAAILQILVLFNVQRYVNRLNEDPDGLANSGYSLLNVIWMVIGVIVWWTAYYAASLGYPA
jgi:hypothetical protein